MMERGLGGSFEVGPWRVRRAGYGAMQLAGDGVFGPSRDRDEALLVLRAAVDAGVDHLDTAQFYGGGTVNQLIREALYPYPEGLAIVSKVGSGHDTRGARVPPDEPYHQLRQAIEDNLTTLGVDRLAAVNLRMMQPARAPGEWFDAQLAALVKAREEGLVDGVGISNISRAHLLRALDQTEIVCVQPLQLGRPAIHRCPRRMHGAWHRLRPLLPARPAWSGTEQADRQPRARPAGGPAAHTPVQVALAWLFGLAPNILLIPGTRTRAHLFENLAAADVVLDAAARAERTRHFPAPGGRNGRTAHGLRGGAL